MPGSLLPAVPASTSKQILLRAGVVLYGLRLTVQDIGQVGMAGVAIDALVLGSTFALACLISTRWRVSSARAGWGWTARPRC